ncbi:MAG: MFS transporter [Ruminococcaceae bacterium]|nr:MFS transporter [Oscillospiraceae bacterium]
MKNFTYTKYACYVSGVSMAIIIVVPAILFETFRELYGISYTLLGTLVVINFVTQLGMDLLFTFFPKAFNVKLAVKLTPFLTASGFLIYSLMPLACPSVAYLWMSIGTVIFSASGGLCEVLLSPIIAAIPSKNPERDMSKLHSCYAWGAVGIVIFSTLFLKLVGGQLWFFLPITMCIIPIIAMLLFMKSEFPEMNMESEKSGNSGLFSKGILLCFFCIFVGGATESVMTQWASSYLESAVRIPKVAGDIMGTAFFAATLGLGRTLYAKYGKNITNVMLAIASGAIVTYTVAALSLSPAVSLIACGLTGICVSMLWPGTLIIVGEKYPGASVAVYAMMAAGGDLGTALAPQVVGVIADKAAVTDTAHSIAERFSITSEQVAMRAGLLSAAVFALLTVIAIVGIKVYFSKRKEVK